MQPFVSVSSAIANTSSRWPANLTESLAAGVDPTTVSAAINERASHIAKLEALAEVELPKKITSKEMDAQAKEVRKIVEILDTDKKRSAVRRYIATMQAIAEERTIKVIVRSPIEVCGHSLVAPKGFVCLTKCLN